MNGFDARQKPCQSILFLEHVKRSISGINEKTRVAIGLAV